MSIKDSNVLICFSVKSLLVPMEDLGKEKK